MIQIPMEKLLITNVASIFLVFISLTSLRFISCNETRPLSYYSHHCASSVPESSFVKDVLSRDEFPHDGRTIHGFYTGGTGILNKTSSFFYQSLSVRTTDKPDLFYVDGALIFEGVGYERSYSYDSGSARRKVYYFSSTLKFGLSGFWLESSGDLCMVGSGSTQSEKGEKLDLDVVFKVAGFHKSAGFGSLIKGSLASLSHDSKPVSLLFFPQLNYQSSTLFFSDDSDRISPFGGGVLPSLPLSSLSRNRICDLMPNRVYRFDLKYTKRFLSEKNNSNNPFGLFVKELPFSLSLKYLQCSEDEKGMLLMIGFQDSDIYKSYYNDRSDFDLNMTWVGEGKWDESENQLEIVACRLFGLEKESYSNAHVGDCSLRLNLQYPAIMSLRNVKQVVGQIWSNKSESRSDGFDFVRLEGSEFFMNPVPGMAYSYTKTDQVLKTCPAEKPVGNESRYPDAYSFDMQFDMSIEMSGKKNSGWGHSTPFFVGDRFYSPYSRSENPTSKIEVSRFNRVNMSYMICISPCPLMKMFGVLNLSTISIFAEGVYDSESGSLCMIGCRDTAPKNQIPEESSMDCEIIVKFQFPEAKSKRSDCHIKGSIESTRKNTDPLFFERMELISAAFDRIEAKRSLWRMDVEVVLALVSISLASVFVAFQIFHVKRKPDVLPFISISMLLLLTFGYMIPLVLNFEALVSPKINGHKFLHTDIGGLKVEVIVRVVILVAFLLQCRLLQLSWSARSSKENRKEAWRAETRALFTTVALHMVGIIITMPLGKSMMNKYGIVGDEQGNYLSTTLATLWTNLKHYSGLVLDGFLLPQILINLFGNWKENVLSPKFYLGTTMINLLPHAYDLYRHDNYARNLDSTYIYASPDVEFFSAASDIIIPLGCLLLALIMFLQQKFGGRFMLSQKYRASTAYEKIPNRVIEKEEA